MVPLINHPVSILQSSLVLMRSCPRVSWCSTLTLTPARGRVSPQPHYMAWGATAHVIGAITAALRQNRITPFATLRALQLLYTPPWPGRGLLLLLLSFYELSWLDTKSSSWNGQFHTCATKEVRNVTWGKTHLRAIVIWGRSVVPIQGFVAMG